MTVDTIGNIYYTKINFLKPNQWKNITVVTSKFHLARTKYLMNKILGQDYTIKYVTTKNGIYLLRLLYQKHVELRLLKLSKFLLDDISDGDDASIATVLNTKHPGYSVNPEYSVDELFAMTSRQWHHRK